MIDSPTLECRWSGAWYHCRSITVEATKKGQVTIPQSIRNALGITPGSEVEFELTGDQALVRRVIRLEVSVGFGTIESLEAAVAGVGFRVLPVPREALFVAGKAFVTYRGRGGSRTRPLPDFFTGGHAAVAGLPLPTRNPVRVRREFPTVEIVESGPPD